MAPGCPPRIREIPDIVTDFRRLASRLPGDVAPQIRHQRRAACGQSCRLRGWGVAAPGKQREPRVGL